MWSDGPPGASEAPSRWWCGGAVRVVAAGTSRLLSISASQLQVTDVAAWRVLRQQVAYRQEGRRCQLRFRRDPDAYLTTLEQRLYIPSLPS